MNEDVSHCDRPQHSKRSLQVALMFERVLTVAQLLKFHEAEIFAADERASLLPQKSQDEQTGVSSL